MNQAYEAQIVRSFDSMAQAHRNLSIAVSQLVTIANRLATLQEKKESNGSTQRQESAIDLTSFPASDRAPELRQERPVSGLIGRATDPPRRPSPKRKGGR